MLAQSLSESTRASYQSAVNHLSRFFENNKALLTFPVTPDSLCLWIADSAAKLRYSSIRHYLHGIATTQLELGYPNPLHQSPLVWRMFKAIKRLQGHHVVRKRLPITVSILSQINHLFDSNNKLHLCMRAAMWLGTCGLLRAGEFVTKQNTKSTLKLQHLTFHDSSAKILHPVINSKEIPSYMSLRLDQSKTDPFRQGTTVVISNPTAIQYMQEYLQSRDITLSRLPLFVGSDGNALSATELVKFTQSFIDRANIPNSHLFLGHSFRKGGATSLHEAGQPDSLIKLMGRWSSFAFATYIDTPVHMLIEAGRSMSLTKTGSQRQTKRSSWDVNNLQ